MKTPNRKEYEAHKERWRKKLNAIEKLFRRRQAENASARRRHYQRQQNSRVKTKFKDHLEQRILRKWDELILQMREEEMKMMGCSTPAEYALRQKAWQGFENSQEAKQ